MNKNIILITIIAIVVILGGLYFIKSQGQPAAQPVSQTTTMEESQDLDDGTNVIDQVGAADDADQADLSLTF